ncbi:hypothetical protein [Vibrio sp. DNB22_19_1]
MENIRLTVLNHCVKAGFITQGDMRSDNPRYIWLEEVIGRNIISLSLLEQVIVDLHEQEKTLDEVSSEVDEQVEVIIKDIAKKILASSSEFSEKEDA